VTTLTRYLLRSHIGPFAFAFLAITGLLLLTAIAQRFQQMAGKGVGPRVILELMLLSLPHVVTLAVPMALFAASLYVFAELSQNRELVAMAAGGVHPARLLAPLLVVGLVLALAMLGFDDPILPAAIAPFPGPLGDVARMSPTLRLRAGALNALHTGDGSTRYVVVRSLDAHTNTLRGVTIADLSRPNRPRFVTAESASVALLTNRRDIALRLSAGQLASPLLDRSGALITVQFQGYQANLDGLAAGLTRTERVGERADRELSFASLRARIRAGHGATGIGSLGELHRRYATAFACVVFVLLAVPLGIRFGNGGIGAVIALSVVILFIFRVGIIWGDRLARAGRIDPVLGSWATVGVLLLSALLLSRMVGSAGYDVRTS